MDNKYVNLRIKKIDTSFLMVALEERLEVWENTLIYERSGESKGETEECSSEYEAEQMVFLWKEFIADIAKQLEGEGLNQFSVLDTEYLDFANRSVDIMEIIIRGSKQMIYVFNDKGYYKVFVSLWHLLCYFKWEEKPVAEFDIERELDRFLAHWDGSYVRSK